MFILNGLLFRMNTDNFEVAVLFWIVSSTSSLTSDDKKFFLSNPPNKKIFQDFRKVTIGSVVVDPEGVQQPLGDQLLVVDSFFFQTRKRHQRMDCRPLGEVPVPVELEGAEVLKLPGHLLLNGCGGDPEVLQGGEAGRIVGQLGLKAKLN